jgi:hypothetical protein
MRQADDAVIDHWREAGFECETPIKNTGAGGRDENRNVGLGPEHDWSSHDASAAPFSALAPASVNAIRSECSGKQTRLTLKHSDLWPLQCLCVSGEPLARLRISLVETRRCCQLAAIDAELAAGGWHII